MECSLAARLCSITILLGAALLPAPRGTQALGDTRWKDMATEQDWVKEIILGIRAVEPPEENSQLVEPGIRVFSNNALAQLGPEEDLDHPLDNARDTEARRVPQRLAVKVQSGPEEDLDRLYHPPDNARDTDARRPPQRLSVKVQSGPEEDLDHVYHS